MLAVLGWGRSTEWLVYHVGNLCAVASSIGLGMWVRANHPHPERNSPELLNPEAIHISTVMLLCSLAFIILLGLVLPLFGCAIIGSSSKFAEVHGYGWHPHDAAVVDFGMQDVPLKKTDRSFLLHHRTYWSGEPVYDYLFTIVNEHSFLGCIYCHPQHPLSRFERIILLAIHVLLLIFPVAASWELLGETVNRMLLVAAIVTGPRNLIKLYLRHVATAADEEVLDHGYRRRGWHVFQLELYEGFVLFTLLGLSIVLSYFCCVYVARGSSDPLYKEILRSCDGLAFAFVLELLIMLVMPHKAQCLLEEPIVFGFIGQWRRECLEVQNGRQPTIQHHNSERRLLSK